MTRVVPDKAITGIHLLIPELKRRYFELIEPPRGAVISELVVPEELFLSLELEDKTVREALNEISIRSGFGWIYEPSLSPRVTCGEFFSDWEGTSEVVLVLWTV